MNDFDLTIRTMQSINKIGIFYLNGKKNILYN
jgi:hypothetical protein